MRIHGEFSPGNRSTRQTGPAGLFAFLATIMVGGFSGRYSIVTVLIVQFVLFSAATYVGRWMSTGDLPRSTLAAATAAALVIVAAFGVAAALTPEGDPYSFLVTGAVEAVLVVLAMLLGRRP